MPHITTFDPLKRYILLSVLVTNKEGKQHAFDALMDTGAPATEFSDEALQYAGLLETKQEVSIKPGLQTQKYGKIIVPKLNVCSHQIDNLEVYVSHFERSWGIKALIGLDFFRRFRVTIDYSNGELITEPFA